MWQETILESFFGFQHKRRMNLEKIFKSIDLKTRHFFFGQKSFEKLSPKEKNKKKDVPSHIGESIAQVISAWQ
jgi:hypothetical protein